jgi:hydroxymethylpyrimidine/phosphomethylpyrimidine kinase
LHQYRALAEEISFGGIKVGMVGCRKNLRALGHVLSEIKSIPVVVDPVFRSSSGTWLLEKETISAYIAKIRGRIFVLTPNLAEAALISGQSVKSFQEMKEAARKISDLAESPCYIKGGHLEKRVIDLLFDGKSFHSFEKEKIKKDVRGTGCFLSSSLVCYLAKGYSLVQASELASDFTHRNIRRAVRAGKGRFVFPPIFCRPKL